MRIGIGITSNGRKWLLNELVESINKFTDMSNVTLYIADDKFDKKGVAFKKNECLRALKDCDYVFLLDDDVKILKAGWVDNFIDSGFDHLLYLNNSHNMIKDFGGHVSAYADCGGVLLFMTKKCIAKVGAFDEKFTGWGLEHADFSKRIALALDSKYNYYCLNNTSEYVYAHDYSNPNHASSISNEDKQKYFNINFPKFLAKIERIFIPL